MPNIGSHEAKIGPPVLLTLVLLTIIPSSPGYIDCRISCRRCHENTEHPAVLEVYCAMCEECKQRRRERMQGRTTKGKENPTSKPSEKPTLKPLTKLMKSKQLVTMRDGVEAHANDGAMIIRPQDNVQFRQAEQDYPGQSHQPFELQQQLLNPPQQLLNPPQQLLNPHQQLLNPPQQLLNPPQRPPERLQPQLIYKPQKLLRGLTYPEGCPTPPICSDSDDDEDRLYFVDPPLRTTPLATTTTTTTTTTQQPCPPVLPCRKKKKTKAPCMNPCMFPPYMCPCPMYPMTKKPYNPGDNPTIFPSVLPPHPMPTPYPYMPPIYPPNPYLPHMFQPPILLPIHPQWQGWLPPTNLQEHEEKQTTPTTSESNVDDKTKNKTITNKDEEFFYLHVGLPVQN